MLYGFSISLMQWQVLHMCKYEMVEIHAYITIYFKSYELDKK